MKCGRHRSCALPVMTFHSTGGTANLFSSSIYGSKQDPNSGVELLCHMRWPYCVMKIWETFPAHIKDLHLPVTPEWWGTIRRRQLGVHQQSEVCRSLYKILTAGTRSFLTSSTALLILISALFCESSTVIRTWRSSFRCSQFGFPLFCSSWTENTERDRQWVNVTARGALERHCSNAALSQRGEERRGIHKDEGLPEKKQDDRTGPLVSYLTVTLKGHPSLIDPMLHRDKDDSKPCSN